MRALPPRQSRRAIPLTVKPYAKARAEQNQQHNFRPLPDLGQVDAIPRAAVAAALAELWAQAEAGAEKWFGHHNEANIYQDFADSILTTITKLGLEGTK